MNKVIKFIAEKNKEWKQKPLDAKFIEKKGKFNFIKWAVVNSFLIDNFDAFTHEYDFAIEKYGVIKSRVTLYKGGDEHVIEHNYPLINHSNTGTVQGEDGKLKWFKSNQDVSSFDLNNAAQRAFAKNIATNLGFGLSLYYNGGNDGLDEIILDEETKEYKKDSKTLKAEQVKKEIKEINSLIAKIGTFQNELKMKIKKEYDKLTTNKEKIDFLKKAISENKEENKKAFLKEMGTGE